MITKTVHCFSPAGEYVTTREIQRQPGQGLPANAIEAAGANETLPVPGENETIMLGLDNNSIFLAPDCRGKTYYSKTTRQQHDITQIGIVPDPDWTDQAPGKIQTWNEAAGAWVDDFKLWMSHVVRPGRDARLKSSDKYMIRDYPITSTRRAEWAAYRQALRDFPDTLSEITDPIPWPQPPDEA